METRNISSFNQLRKSSLVEQAAEKPDRTEVPLSDDEQKMIKSRFSGKAVSLELYGGTGEKRNENPNARGSNIDLTV